MLISSHLRAKSVCVYTYRDKSSLSNAFVSILPSHIVQKGQRHPTSHICVIWERVCSGSWLFRGLWHGHMQNWDQQLLTSRKLMRILKGYPQLNVIKDWHFPEGTDCGCSFAQIFWWLRIIKMVALLYAAAPCTANKRCGLTISFTRN